MNAFAAFADLLEERPPEVPRFFVQAPDLRRDWTEKQRQCRMFRIMKAHEALIEGHAIPNAGKRHPSTARAEGIKSGVFDTNWNWRTGSAWVEFKGFAGGRTGALSEEQIRWGNLMLDLGKNIACFFDPYAAAEWVLGLAEDGAG